MKKLMKSLMLFAAAAMALTSCENEVMNEGIETNDTYTLNFVTGAPESKTSVSIDGNTASFAWSESETFHFVQKTSAGLKKGSNVSYNKNAEGQAEITATFTETGSPIVAVYPEAAWVSNTDDYNKAKLIVLATQNLTEGTFAPDADLMVSKEVTPETETDTHLLQFTRLVAVGKMTIKGLPIVGSEVIEKVNFSISSENALTGRLYINLATAEVSEWGYYGNASKEVALVNGAMDATAANDIYFTCMPSVVAAGETFTVKVTTDKAIYTHSVTIPEGKSINFSSGRVSAFGVNMASATREDNNAIALPWSEGFDSEDLSAYTIVNGESDTKVWPDEALAGGTKGEILIGKKGGSMTATIASDGTAKTLNLWFKSNNPSNISASSATEGVTITKLSNYGYTVALAEGVSTFKLTLENTTGSNARVDDIVLTEEAPAIEKLTVSGATLSFTAGDTFATGENFTVSAVYQNGVSEKVTATVDSSDVNMNAAGTYTVTVSYNGVSTTYDITVVSASVQTKTVSLGNGTFANSTITWTQDGVTVVQAKGNSSTAVSSSYASASTMRLYQGHTLTFSCATNITKIEMVTKSNNFGKTATVDVGTLNNPQTSGCTITWTGSAKKIVLTNGTGSGGSQIQTSSIKITYEVSGGSTPAVVAPTITVDNQEVPAEGATNATADVDLGSPAGDWTYTVTDDADWLTATWTTNAVTYTAEANTVAEKRSATVTITAKLSGQTDVTEEFTITQAAAEVVEPEQPGGGDVETKISTLTVETINAVKEMGNGSYGNYKDTDVTITVEGVTYVAKNICATAKNTPNGFAAKTFIQIKNGNYIYNTTAVKSVKIWSNGETYNVNGGSSKNPTTKLTASNSSKENVDVKDNNGNSKTASLFVKEFDITGGYFKINTTAATYIYKVEVTY